MTPKKLFVSIAIIVGTLLPGCNLYSPLEGSGSVQDHLEIAQSCLTNGDYDCAAAEYSALPAGSQKDQKLCALYLSQAGFGLSTLVTVFNTTDKKKSLGVVANRILPYTASRQSGADNAKTHCANFKASAAAGDEQTLAELLRTLSLFTHCAVLMAKTTVVLGASDADTACTTASTHTAVTSASISSDGAGAADPGMCSADAVACLDDINQLSTSTVTGDLNYIKEAYDQIKAQFPGAGSTAARAGLITTL